MKQQQALKAGDRILWRWKKLREEPYTESVIQKNGVVYLVSFCPKYLRHTTQSGSRSLKSISFGWKGGILDEGEDRLRRGQSRIINSTNIDCAGFVG